ncbi:MAG TPA: hypothetical protein VGX68_10315 [Thermoanaerobaculia bacterium]|jgi:hypothetical protein|nr:hypothetical protein [Thermoanaerobaculia bacterium]
MDQSNKHGLRSDSKKEASTRHGFEPAPDASPVPGAFGKHGKDRGSEDLSQRNEEAEREKMDH